MNRRIAAIAASLLVALPLLLGTGPAYAQATVVFGDPQEPGKATGILNLDVPGFGTFDVTFDQQAFALEIYGPFPGDLTPLPPFFTLSDTEAAANAVNAALNAESGVSSIGEVGLPGTEAHNIGFNAFIGFELPAPAIAVIRTLLQGADWSNTGENFLCWDLDQRDWAVFAPVPEPGSPLLRIAALATLGVIRRWRR